MKKVLFIFVGVLFIGLSQVLAQSSYEMYEPVGGTTVRVMNGDLLHKTMPATNPDFEFPILVKNISAVNCTTWVKKVYLNILTGTTNWFCWDVCYFPNTMVSAHAHIIGPGQSFNGFYAHYNAANQIGDSRIRYVFFNGANASDTAYFEVTFTSSSTGVGDDLSGLSPLKVYPSPVNRLLHADFNLTAGSQGTLVLRNILGKEMGNFPIEGHSGPVTIDVSGYPDGVYFCVLNSGDKITATRKIIINH